jgi:hypothetical protein
MGPTFFNLIMEYCDDGTMESLIESIMIKPEHYDEIILSVNSIYLNLEFE